MQSRRRVRGGVLSGIAVLSLASAAAVAAEPLHFGPHDVTSLFTISKSENKNEVVFAIHLDEHCAPIGAAPVVGFWRMYELGPHVIQPLLSREQEAYGIAHQEVLARSDDGGRVQMTLRALPDRPVEVETRLGADGRCTAWPRVTIAGEPAYVYNVYVKLGFLKVDSIDLSGWALDRTRVLRERVAH